MKISFMTLGCPTWDLRRICEQGQAAGYDGVDFRGVGADLDITRTPAFTTDVASTRKMLADHGLAVSGISTSIFVCEAKRRAASLDEARRTIDVATALGTTNVRIFGGGEGADGSVDHARLARVGAGCIEEILALPDARSLSWNFETHDHWTSSADCLRLLEAITDAAFGAAWDVAHTRRVAGESPEQTLAAIGSRVRYVHVKDAVRAAVGEPGAGDDGWRYVLPGKGELEPASAIAALARYGYDGWLMFEHEKRWHPELEEPEVALPAYAAWARRVIAG